ncbi:DNA polymerase III subunit epsilon [Rickettsiella endosymbiont of Miltochrista miniata]|uniref:DNA polymerase III subunit epsilon n=1 Tax=Rickettsiella endosymbiont of Miltochrista miniata TaxID=3066239 RepID=UPI00313D79BF
MRQIILDTETTGRDINDGHRIIEIGCLELIDRRLTKRFFHCFLNPGRDSETGAFAVHGLSTEFLKDKPLFKTIAEELLAFIQDSQLIIHNAPFDLGFLNNEFKLTKKKYKKITDYCQVLDTLPLARQLHPGQRNSLDALCKRYAIDNSKREKHGALLDAELLARVYLAMTGGQTHLFTEEKRLAATQTIQHKKITGEIVLPVIYATNEELITHESRLASINKLSGQCKWPSKS